MNFEFYSPVRIQFGINSSKCLINEIPRLGSAPLLLTGKTAHSDDLPGLLTSELKNVTVLKVSGEPSIDCITEAVRTARNVRSDVVVGIGGGSVIDTAKAVSALVNNPGEPLDYLEVIGGGKVLSHPPLPCIAVPTTAGTGSEVTKNAVLHSTEDKLKVSLRSPFLYPRLAVVDPHLTRSLPPSLTASTGCDALTQCIESFISCRATPFTDIISAEGIRCAARSLPDACSGNSDNAARTDLSFSALLSGIALANSGLGAVHGFAAVIGGMTGIAHGTICALLLRRVLTEVIREARRQEAGNPVVRKLGMLAALISDNRGNAVESINDSLDNIYSALPLPAPGTVPIDRTHFPAIVAAARNASSMKGSPVVFSDEVLHSILESTFG